MVLPAAHRGTPFDLTATEWAATLRLLRSMRDVIDERYRPAGYNVGWNVHPVAGQSVPHAHCHFVPRYADEPFAGKGLRWWFKSEANQRGDPSIGG